MALVFLLRASDGRDFPVAGTLRIGRAPESEIVLADDRVSRLHARVWPDGDRLFIRDEGSSNGTTVNGRPLAAGQTYRLRPDDRLGVGGTVFTIATGLPATGPLPTGQPASAAVPPGAVSPTAQSALVPPPPPISAPLPATTRIDNPVPVPARAASHRSRNLLVGGCLALLLLAVCGGLGVYGATAGRPALGTALAQVGGGVPGVPTPPPAFTPSAPPGPGTVAPATPGPTSSAFTARVVSTSPPVTALAPAEYAATGQDLATTLAALNQAQLRFIADAKANRAALDEDLRTIAASAFKVGLDGETLAGATAAQDNASNPAATMAGLYAGLARDGFAQAIDAQNMRTSLAAGTLDAGTATSQIADYGARAWNPDVSDPAVPGNPFLSHLAPGDQIPTPAAIPPAGQAAIITALGSGPGPFTWLAAPSVVVTRTVSIPLAPPLADPQDPTLLAKLITPAGQVDGVSAQQAAAEGLLRLGATQQQPSGHHPDGLLAALWPPPQQTAQQVQTYSSPGSVLLSGATKQDKLQAFGNGHAAAAKANPPASGGNSPNVVDYLFGTDANNQPDQPAVVPIQLQPAELRLSIANIHVDAVSPESSGLPYDAKTTLSFDISWVTSAVVTKLNVRCSQTEFNTDQPRGTQHITVNALQVLYPGDAMVNCYAFNPEPSLATASIEVTLLVGGPDGATQRAAIVETEFMARNETEFAGWTVTAAAGTDIANRTATAQTQAAAQTAAGTATQSALETEHAATQDAERAARMTEIAAQTATAAAGGAFTINGTFNLVQGDSGCQFSDAPSTSGTLQMTIDFGTGQATATFTGGGAGARTLSCSDGSGTMHWQQSYTANFVGTVDKTTGALSLSGTLNGSNNVSWSGCQDGNGDDAPCPAGYGHGYSLKVILSGTADKTSHTAKGTWDVQPIVLPTSGDWGGG